MSAPGQSSPIREAIDNAVAYLTAHPDEARYTDSPATARIESGLRVTVTGTSGESVSTDMVPSIGGAGSAPGPGWLFRAAQASCVATLIRMRSEMLGTAIEDVAVTVDSESDDRGILGIDPATPAGPLSTRIVVSVSGGAASRDDLEAIVEWAVDHCPVTDATRRAVPIEVTVTD